MSNIVRLNVDQGTKSIIAASGYSYGSFKNSDSTHSVFINESHIRDISDRAMAKGFKVAHV